MFESPKGKYVFKTVFAFNAAAFRTSTDYFDVYNVNSPDEENIFKSNLGDKYSMTRNEAACLSVRLIATGEV